MKKNILFFSILVVFSASNAAFSQEATFCGVAYSASNGFSERINPILMETQNLVVVMVDFPDGRDSLTGLPPIDTLDLRRVKNLDAVGSLGWSRDPLDTTKLIKHVRKYTYEDYWDWLFSVGEYDTLRHPDLQSHGIKAYGSLKDFYSEVSYGNLTINPYQTWTLPPNNYRQGIANAIDTANGKRYVRWIVMPHPKAYYATANNDALFEDVESTLAARHQLLTTDSDYVDFNIGDYLHQRILVVSAGGRYKDFEGIASPSNFNWILSVEKIKSNTNPLQSVFTGIKIPVHEYGHSLGFEHIQAGSYDPMNQGVFGIYLYCPTHFNAWHKLIMGWIPLENVIKIGTDSSAIIFPVSQAASCATVTIYGDAGRNSDWRHSEYFIVEYRKREKFDRFIGGEFAPGFSGGLLVWQYSSSGFFQVNIPTGGNGSIVPKVSDDLGTFYSNTGNPAHFFGYNGLSLTPSTYPNTNARIDSVTGISLNNFIVASTYGSFGNQYARGYPPRYDWVVAGTPSDIAYSGLIYLDKMARQIPFPSLSIQAGSFVECLPGGNSIQLSSMRASGSAAQPIEFRGVGYAGNHASYGSITLSPADTGTIITYCRFDKSEGISVTFAPWDASLGGPVIAHNTFAGTINQQDMLLTSNSSDPSSFPFLNNYDKNDFLQMRISGNWRCSIPFYVGPGRSLHWIAEPANSPVSFGNSDSGSIYVQGVFNCARNSRIINGRLSVIDSGLFTGENSLTLAGQFVLESHRANGILSLGTPTTIDTASTITFQGDPVEFSSLLVRQNAQLGNVPTLSFSGGTCTVESGAVLSMRVGSSISGFSQLTASGTLLHPIIFTRSGFSGTWSGISAGNCNPSSNSILNYARIYCAGTAVHIGTGTKLDVTNSLIDQADIGIEFVPSEFQCPEAPPHVDITDNSFTNIGTSGIVVNNFSDLSIERNSIDGACSVCNEDHWGIILNNSSPTLLDNKISDFDYGMMIMSNSSPLLQGVFRGGHNQIRENVNGIGCDQSDPVLGAITERNPDGGQNSFVDSNLEASLTGGSEVPAENNWWGKDEDPSDKFYLDDSKISYTPWLDKDPNQSNRPSVVSATQAVPKKAGDAKDGGAGGRYTPIRAEILNVIQLRSDQRYTDALQALLNSITQRTLPVWLRRWAVRQALAVSQRMPAAQLSSYLLGLQQQYPDLVLQIKSVVPSLYLHEQRRSDAIAMFDRNILENPNTSMERAGLYEKFLDKLYVEQNISDAATILTAMNQRYNRSPETKLAAKQLQNYRTEGTGHSLAKGIAAGTIAQSTNPLPHEFAFRQNYPNPFNPATTITFDLPEASQVSLNVYDVLGRKVTEIANGNYAAGYHSTTWYASDFASGVYTLPVSLPPMQMGG